MHAAAARDPRQRADRDHARQHRRCSSREVTRLYGNKRIWITEYGYQTNPPDRLFGVCWRNQARYLTQA